MAEDGQSIITFDRKSRLGSGGFGHVLLGTFNGESVAVKRIEHHKRCLDREEKALKMLDHPNVMKLLGIMDTEDYRNYALELCAGSLDQLFLPDDDPKRYKGPPLPRQIKVLLQLARGLAYIHSKGLVHRDIKPENILISIKSHPVTLKWADFGLTKETDDEGFYEMSGHKGTLYWMAPEIWAFTIRGRETTTGSNRFNCASDVFSAGCLFFNFVTGGVHPFGSIIRRDVSSNIESNNPVNLLNESVLPKSHFSRDIIANGMLNPEAHERLKMEEVVSCILKKMEEELYRECSVKDPTDFEANKLIELLNDEDCPHLITVELGHRTQLKLKQYTLLELLCKTNNSRKLKQFVEIVLLKHEKKHGPDQQETLNGTRALDYVCEYHNPHYGDLLDIVRLLTEHTRIDYNRPSLRLQYVFKDAFYQKSLAYGPSPTHYCYEMIQIILKSPLFLFGLFNEFDINKPEFRIRHLFQKYLNPLKCRRPFLKQHQLKAAAASSLFKLYATIEEKAMLQILPHLEPDLEEKIPVLISHLENLIEDLQLEFDRQREDLYNKPDLQVSKLFRRLFYNKQWRNQPESISILFQTIELLLEKGLNIDARDHPGERNALHLHIFDFSNNIHAVPEVTKLLIEKGIDVNAKSIDHQTPLHYLLKQLRNIIPNEVEIAKLIIEKGANVNAKDEHGMNVLHHLCTYYHGENIVELCKLFVDNGVRIDDKDNQGMTPLICVCTNYTIIKRKVEMLQFLIERDSDACAKDVSHQNGLHHLCSGCQYGPVMKFDENERVKLAEMLLNKGVDINATDISGKTALHWLVETSRGALPIYKLLVENGIDVNAKDNEGRDVWYSLENEWLYEREEIKKILLSCRPIDCRYIPEAKKQKMIII